MRKMVWSDGLNCYTCSECGWVFQSPRITTVMSDRMLHERAKEQFEEHDCANSPKPFQVQ